jgi:hypothetical protein
VCEISEHILFRFRFRLFCDRRSVGQSVLVSGPHLGPFYEIFITVGHLRSSCRGAPSLTRRRVCNLLVQFAYSSVQVPQKWPHLTVSFETIFYCLIRDSPNLEGQVPVLISPRNRVAQLYPWALGSLSVASYDSQVYDEGILTSLHRGSTILY